MKKLLFLFLFITAFTACKKDDEATPLTQPTIEHLELGYGNNKIGVLGTDFHLDADILAGDKFENVQVKILQKPTETYAKAWEYELTWDQYKGAKNANVHKHFTIPADAPEGTYDFYFIINDQNGTKLEVKEDFRIFHPDNVPVNPSINLKVIRNMNLNHEGEELTEGGIINKGDSLYVDMRISGVSDEGIIYALLVKQKNNYHPETAVDLDFSKAIVIGKDGHEDLPKNSNYFIANWDKIIDNSVFPHSITIGATHDNNKPHSNLITAANAWESGNYHVVVVYTNTTHNISMFKSFPVKIQY